MMPGQSPPSHLHNGATDITLEMCIHPLSSTNTKIPILFQLVHHIYIQLEEVDPTAY